GQLGDAALGLGEIPAIGRALAETGDLLLRPRGPQRRGERGEDRGCLLERGSGRGLLLRPPSNAAGDEERPGLFERPGALRSAVELGQRRVDLAFRAREKRTAARRD